MASNLSSLGFDVSDGESLEDLVLTLADNATVGLRCDAGEYRIWRSRTGAELWLHLAEEAARTNGADAVREIVGLTPFFEGESVVEANLTERFQRDGDNAFEGSLHCWIAPPAPSSAKADGADGEVDDDGAGDTAAEDFETGSYPLIFDCVDYAAHETEALPVRAKLRLAGFVRELKAYADEAAFEAAQSETGFPLAAQAFFTVGMFAAAEAASGSEDDATQPSSHAMFTGRVLKTERLTNEETDQPFHWALVESLDATFDIVADPSSIEGPLAEGAIVQVACWMFGRILSGETEA